MDPDASVPEVRALGGVVADSVANRRFEMDLLLLFAASALLLAGLGVYGVVTYSVVQRQQEIGLRLALGADKRNIYGMVLRDGLTPIAVGAAIGVVAAFASARVITSLLFQVSPYDPLVTGAAIGNAAGRGCDSVPASSAKSSSRRPDAGVAGAITGTN